MEANAGYAGNGENRASETSGKYRPHIPTRAVAFSVRVCGFRKDEKDGNYANMQIWYFCNVGGRGFTRGTTDEVIALASEYRRDERISLGHINVELSVSCRPNDKNSLGLLEEIVAGLNKELNGVSHGEKGI